MKPFNEHDIPRRDLLSLLGIGGVVYASALTGAFASVGCGRAVTIPNANSFPKANSLPQTTDPNGGDFMFMQLSDTHWGYSGPANPEATTTLPSAVATINTSPVKPDFIVFTGDLTQTTDDAAERRRRMTEFKRIVADLDVKALHFIPGEHDASIDGGEAFRELFGNAYYSFQHRGFHFVALDNVSDPAGQLGPAQLEWLAHEVARVPQNQPLVVFAHRPLFDLYPNWDWTTRDANAALQLLARHPRVTVFYGHIHQEHHYQTGNILHHASRSLVFPLPAPGSVGKKAPLPWNPDTADHGLGYRSVTLTAHEGSALAITERPLLAATVPASVSAGSPRATGSSGTQAAP